MARLLHVIATTDPATGGPIEGLRQRAEALRRMGHETQVVCCDTPESPWLTDQSLPILALGPGRGRFGFTPNLVPWLLAHAGEFDYVVVNGIWQYNSLGTRKAMLRLGKPYVVFTHGMLDPWFKRAYPFKHLKKWLYWPWGDYRVLRDAAAVLFTSDEERVLARQSFWLYRAKERVVHYGTGGPAGEAKAQVEAFEDRFPELQGRRFLLFLSRIHEKKGCDLLLRAFARLEDRDLRLVIAGPDQVGWVAELQGLAQRLGVADRVTWPGMLSGDLKWGAFQSCEAFVLPSHQENFGIVVAEALACGKPVLISNKVNIWREIESAGAGLVAGDTQAGTDELLARWTAMTAAEREAMTAKARPCFEANFEIEQAARSLLQVLAEVVGPPK
ncbi:MAG TPA: glycosyltransferase [Fimbriimonadaceae bacterium]|nr:glycosyltransferase [Fimbriimonadaceae bacterium]